MDNTAAFLMAHEIAKSDPVLRVYAAPEWDELNDDGKLWIVEIVRQAFTLGATRVTYQDRRALIAASQASEAATELLRYFAEGPASDRAFGDVDVICKLAEALKLAADIECEHLEPFPHTHHEMGETRRLAATCAQFIEGWAG